MIRPLLFAALFVIGSGCSPRIDEIARVRNPTGDLEAVHAQPRTDATVGFVHWVYVVSAGSRPRSEPVFVADNVTGPLRLSWSGDVLTITADRARVFKAAPVTAVATPKGSSAFELKVTVADPLN